MSSQRILVVLFALAVSPQCKESEQADLELPDLEAPRLLEGLEIDTSPEDALVLAFKPVEAAAWDVAMVQKSAQERADKKMTTGSRQTFRLENKLQENKGGSWTSVIQLKNVSIKPLEGKEDKTAEGPLLALRSALESLRFKVTTDPRGTVLDLALEGPQAAQLRGMKELIERMVADSSVVLSEQAVAPRGTWETRRSSATEKGASRNVLDASYSSEFLGWADCGSSPEKCAVVRTRGEFTVSGGVAGKEMDAEVKGSGRTDSVVLLNLAKGRVEACGVKGVSIQRFIVGARKGGPEFTDTTWTDVEWRLAPAAAHDGGRQEGKK